MFAEQFVIEGMEPPTQLDAAEVVKAEVVMIVEAASYVTALKELGERGAVDLHRSLRASYGRWRNAVERLGLVVEMPAWESGRVWKPSEALGVDRERWRELSEVEVRARAARVAGYLTGPYMVKRRDVRKTLNTVLQQLSNDLHIFEVDEDAGAAEAGSPRT